jgi:MFS family permease
MHTPVRKGEFHPDIYEEYLLRHYRHNYIVNTLDVGFFAFGMSMLSVSVILPAFVLQLNGSTMLIAFLPAIQTIGYTLPQVISSHYIERSPRVKPLIMTMGFFQRIPWVLTGLLIPLLACKHPAILLSAFTGLYLLASISGGLIAPAWGEMIAKSIPAERRGRFMSGTQLLGNLLGLAGGVYVSLVMSDRWIPYPFNYATLFISAGVMLFLSFAFFTRYREPLVAPLHGQQPSIREHLRSLPRIFKHDRQFSRLIGARLLLLSSGMTAAFLMVYAIKAFDLTDASTGRFVLTTTLSGIVASLVLGKLADRFGNKAVLMLSATGTVLLSACALTAKHVGLLHCAFAFLAISRTGTAIASQNIIFDFAPPGKRPTYLGIAGTITAPFAILYSLVGGFLADRTPWGYASPIMLAVVLNVCALVVLSRTSVPRSPARLRPESA